MLPKSLRHGFANRFDQEVQYGPIASTDINLRAHAGNDVQLFAGLCNHATLVGCGDMDAVKVLLSGSGLFF